MYEIFLPETDTYWDDDMYDLDDFDETITGRLEELQLAHGIQRPIFYFDQETDRLDKLRSIERMEQSDFRER